MLFHKQVSAYQCATQSPHFCLSSQFIFKFNELSPYCDWVNYRLWTPGSICSLFLSGPWHDLFEYYIDKPNPGIRRNQPTIFRRKKDCSRPCLHSGRAWALESSGFSSPHHYLEVVMSISFPLALFSWSRDTSSKPVTVGSLRWMWSAEHRAWHLGSAQLFLFFLSSLSYYIVFSRQICTVLAQIWKDFLQADGISQWFFNAEELQSHLEGLLEHIAGPHPQTFESADLGGGW